MLSPESHDPVISKLTAGETIRWLRWKHGFQRHWMPASLALWSGSLLACATRRPICYWKPSPTAKSLLQKFQGKNVLPLICPMVPFLDPGSRFLKSRINVATGFFTGRLRNTDRRCWNRSGSNTSITKHAGCRDENCRMLPISRLPGWFPSKGNWASCPHRLARPSCPPSRIPKFYSLRWSERWNLTADCPLMCEIRFAHITGKYLLTQAIRSSHSPVLLGDDGSMILRYPRQ